MSSVFKLKEFCQDLIKQGFSGQQLVENFEQILANSIELEVHDPLKKILIDYPKLKRDWKWTWDESQHNPDQGILSPKFLETFYTDQDTMDQHEKTGSVYTPAIITHSMVSYVLDKWIHENPNQSLNTLRIIEPCAGPGAFIIALFDELKNRFVREQKNNSDEIIWQLLANFFQENCCAFDINEIALKIAQIRLQSRFITQFPNLPINKISEIRLHYVVGNALDHPWNVKKENPHIIIGNPPYVSADTMRKYFTEIQIKKLKEEYRHVIKKGSKPDLFFYFLAHGCHDLRENGRLAFIIPNRILSNDYAQTIRRYLRNTAPPEYILDFSPTLDIFGDANVHPCIIILHKPEQSQNQEIKSFQGYRSVFLTELDPSQELIIHKLPAMVINPFLIEQYGVFFTQIDSLQQQILTVASKFPRLHQICTIHEATRLARFEGNYPPNIAVRISAQDWTNLTVEKRQIYLQEIRGEDIADYGIKPPKLYLTLPELTKTADPSKLEDILSKYQVKTVYIRELGKKIFIAFNRGVNPNIGYGGVYFIQELDIQKTSTVSLWGLFAYLSSKIPLLLYKILFAAGSWGNALKYRSSYLQQLPFIASNPKSLHGLGLLLEYFAIKKDKINLEFVVRQIDLQLIGLLLLQIPNSSIIPAEMETLQQFFIIPTDLEKDIQETITAIQEEHEKNGQNRSLVEIQLDLIRADNDFLRITQKIISEPFAQILHFDQN